jgi:two-component system cell cycle response regulator
MDMTGAHILVAEDDEHTRNLLRDVCRSSGYSVDTVGDGEEVLPALTAREADLLLLDLIMPGKDGFTVLQELRAHAEWKELPVVILTGMEDLDGKIRGMELGADDYITKPFRLIELQTRLRSVFTLRDYRRQLAAAQKELIDLKAVDAVTGSGSYSQLKLTLDTELARSRRHDRALSVLLLGIQDYPGLRFSLGREKCEELLIRIAGTFRQSLREIDRLFRLQPDQFILVLPETDAAGAKVAASRLLELTREFAPQGRNGKMRVRARIGAALFPTTGIECTEDLLREAQRAYQIVPA